MRVERETGTPACSFSGETEAGDTMPAAASSLAEVAREAARCQRCPLYKLGTQTVFGAGPADAPVMLVGEQPGDHEDRQGLPFVGPAGLLLDRALDASGIDRGRVYVTNAVKHFKHIPRGKRRLHQKPNAGEIDRCKWWLDLELEIIRPELTVALGATAARSLLGRPVKIAALRGTTVPLGNETRVLVTVHPSMLLRLPDAESKAREFELFVADLRKVALAVPSVRR
jgi:uracil-DNA glycosylase family protein